MPKVYFANVAREVAFERVCCHCNNSWPSQGTASSGQMMEQTKQDALTTAESVLNEEMKNWRDNRDVLCPNCSHFSTDAMEIHFRKGYPAAIIRNYKRASWADFLLFVCVGWIPLLLFLFANLKPWDTDTPARAAIFLALFLATGIPALMGLLIFIWSRVALASVRKKLDGLSQDELRQLAVECYRKNKNSLKVEIDAEAGLFNPWLKKPLLYKTETSVADKVASG
jgi:hypothetical protein